MGPVFSEHPRAGWRLWGTLRRVPDRPLQQRSCVDRRRLSSQISYLPESRDSPENSEESGSHRSPPRSHQALKTVSAGTWGCTLPLSGHMRSAHSPPPPKGPGGLSPASALPPSPPSSCPPKAAPHILILPLIMFFHKLPTIYAQEYVCSLHNLSLASLICRPPKLNLRGWGKEPPP